MAVQTRHVARPTEDFSVAWAQALDELELEVDRAERLLRAVHDPGSHHPGEAFDESGAALDVPWVAPRIREPLPASMVERAQLLLERQLATAGRLATAMTTSRRHMDVVETLARAESRPMYVDQAL